MDHPKIEAAELCFSYEESIMSKASLKGRDSRSCRVLMVGIRMQYCDVVLRVQCANDIA